MKFRELSKQVVWIVFMTILLLGVPRLARVFANFFDFSALDPDGAFAWISVRHIFQAVIVMALMIAISKASAIRFGLHWGDRRVGLLYVRITALVFAGYSVVSMLIIVLVGSFQVFQYPLTARNIIGHLGFQLLLSGPSEELIFRAFAITMLTLTIKGTIFSNASGAGKAAIKALGGPLSFANLIAAIIFGLAHIAISFPPFSFSFNTFQVIYSVVLGLFYGVCFERSKSVVYPMLMHSITNVVAVSMSVIAGAMIA